MMETEKVIDGLKQLRGHCGFIYGVMIDEAIKYLSTYDQIKRERGIAIEQLKQLGYSLGEQPREPDSDLISRRAAIDALIERERQLRAINWYKAPTADYECVGINWAMNLINDLPPTSKGDKT